MLADTTKCACMRQSGSTNTRSLKVVVAIISVPIVGPGLQIFGPGMQIVGPGLPLWSYRRTVFNCVV